MTTRRDVTSNHNNHKSNVVIVDMIVKQDAIKGKVIKVKLPTHNEQKCKIALKWVLMLTTTTTIVKIQTKAIKTNDITITLTHRLLCRLTHDSNKHNKITNNIQTDVNIDLGNGNNKKVCDLFTLLHHTIVIVSISIIKVVVATTTNRKTIMMAILQQTVKAVLVKTIAKVI